MGGRREVSIIFYRPVTRSDLKQETSFFRGSVSSFLQLVVAKGGAGRGGAGRGWGGGRDWSEEGAKHKSLMDITVNKRRQYTLGPCRLFRALRMPVADLFYPKHAFLARQHFSKINKELTQGIKSKQLRTYNSCSFAYPLILIFYRLLILFPSWRLLKFRSGKFY